MGMSSALAKHSQCALAVLQSEFRWATCELLYDSLMQTRSKSLGEALRPPLDTAHVKISVFIPVHNSQIGTANQPDFLDHSELAD
jgi:hypothetical protein